MTTLEVPGQDVTGVRAANPSPLTLSGTNSWVVGRDPAWLIDPGPALDDHVAALVDEVEARGGLGGFALTHDHSDHSDAVPAIRERFPHAPLAAATPEADVRLQDGSSFGPLAVVATPGHAPDHLAYISGEVGFTGDAVLGEGSVFISPYPGSLRQYLAGLERLRARPLTFLCPGHGPLIENPQAKLDQYLSHRSDRESRLMAALGRGARSVQELLDDAWSDVPAPLRPAAALTLRAHLDKLEEEGRLPPGVEKPREERLPRRL
jgi:glyoxylase-like metal-dependent hydrolase (beta-lactamase superfamily II)